MDPHSTRNATSFITFQTGLTTDNYCSISALALLVYEYIILLDKEVDLFWNRKVAGASALFLLNRYLPIVAYIIRPSTMIQMSCLSNSIMQLMSQTLAFLQYIPWAAFSALRAFALCEPPYNWPIAALVFMLSSVSIVTNFTRFYWIVPVPANPVFGGSDCVLYEVHPPVYIEVYFSLAARACLIAADFIVLCVTWRATSYKFPRLVRNSIRGVGTKKDTFANIIFRDGVIYFIVLSDLRRPPGEQAYFTRWSLVFFTRPGNSVQLRALAGQSSIVADAVDRKAPAHLREIFESGQTSFEWFTRQVKNMRTNNQKGADV